MLALISMSSLLGMIYIDLCFDHWILMGNLSEEKVNRSLAYYKTMETEPIHVASVIPVVILITFANLIRQVVKQRKLSDIAVCGKDVFKTILTKSVGHRRRLSICWSYPSCTPSFDVRNIGNFCCS